MRPLWLIGKDIAGSPSPALHNSALAAMGRAEAYSLRPVATRDELRATFDEAAHTCRGVNVTAPYKLDAYDRYEDVADDLTRDVGAVNTVVYDAPSAHDERTGSPGRARLATNTDVHGVLVAWRRANFHVEDKLIAIYGAGGAARAALVAAKEAGARGVVLHARRSEAARSMAAHAARIELDAVALEPGDVRALGCTLLVLAATELASEVSAALFARGLEGRAAVHDLRYGPRTRAARDAALTAGHLYADGTTMVLAQAERALEVFLGETLSDDARRAMARAVSESLKRA